MVRPCLGLEEEDDGGALRGRWGRGRWWWRDSVYGLRNRTAVVRSEAGDETTACFRPRIEDGRWWRHDGI
jgi:hypothetical protein